LWKGDEGIVYAAFHKDDKELPYEILLGAITDFGIQEQLALN
jgi:hypothetical protein